MLDQAAPVAIASAAVFGALALMSDRPRGALIAQAGLALAGALIFVAIILDAPLLGWTPDEVITFAVGVMAACVAGMLYHLYLGRFASVIAARGVFTLVFLGLAALFGLVFLSLI